MAPKKVMPCQVNEFSDASLWIHLKLSNANTSKILTDKEKKKFTCLDGNDKSTYDETKSFPPEECGKINLQKLTPDNTVKILDDFAYFRPHINMPKCHYSVSLSYQNSPK